MNFTSLQYFLLAVEDLNFSHTASKLYISQQALSGHIIRLEKELGVPLFNRTPMLSLTPAGELLADYAKSIITIRDQILQISADTENNLRGTVRIGISHTCGRAVLPAILPKYRKTHPLINVQVQEGNSTELETWLLNGELDLIICFAPFVSPDISSECLIRERLFLVVPKAMLEKNFGACYDAVKSECQRDLDVSLFEHMPFILLKRGNRFRNIFDNYMRDKGFTPNIIFETENTETAYSLCEKGMGITIYPELFLVCIPRYTDKMSRPVELFPIPEDSTIGSLCLGWIDGRYQTRAIRDFVAVTKEAMNEFVPIDDELPILRADFDYMRA